MTKSEYKLLNRPHNVTHSYSKNIFKNFKNSKILKLIFFFKKHNFFKKLTFFKKLKYLPVTKHERTSLNRPSVGLVLELTCPFDARTNIDGARKRKTERYPNLHDDLSENFKCELITLEICSRGYIDKENCSRLAHICKIFKIKHIRDLTVTLSKLALIGSRIIYNGRHSPSWTSDYNYE